MEENLKNGCSSGIILPSFTNFKCSTCSSNVCADFHPLIFLLKLNFALRKFSVLIFFNLQIKHLVSMTSSLSWICWICKISFLCSKMNPEKKSTEPLNQLFFFFSWVEMIKRLISINQFHTIEQSFFFFICLSASPILMFYNLPHLLLYKHCIPQGCQILQLKDQWPAEFSSNLLQHTF